MGRIGTWTRLSRMIARPATLLPLTVTAARFERPQP